MLRHDTINPLNLHNLRRVDYCPPHFLPVYFELRTKEKVISDWIFEYLAGRFFFDTWTKTENGKSIIQYCAAFEEHSEASYFSLMLTDINKPNSSY